MPLHLFAILVVAGIAVIILLVYALDQRMPKVIASPNIASKDFCAEHPGTVVTHCVVTNDGQAAILALKDERIGIMRIMGAKYFTRVLSAKDARLAKVSPKHNALGIKLSGFGEPRVKFRFDDDDEIARLAALFDNLRNADDNRVAP